MSEWSPVWEISIDGGIFTEITLANLATSAGRTDIYTQPVASYCNLEIVQTDLETFAIEINNSIAVRVKDTTGTYVSVFGGYVTDIDQSVVLTGSLGIVQTYKITALGALSKLPKVLTDGVLSRAYDGDQIYSVLQNVLFNTWAEVPSAITWDTYDPATETWANAQNVGLGEIDTPGDYELTDRASSTTNVYSLVSALATSGLGYIYEDSQGRISYADSTHRVEYLAANGYLGLSANHALSRGIATSRRIGDIRNKVTITYKNGAQETATDATSQISYGEQGQNITTSLHNAADATSQAAFYLALRAYPQSIFKSITYELTNSELDDADRNALLGVFMGLPVDISDLPVNLNGGSFQGFVEGWSFSTGFNKLSVTLLLSPVAFSIQYMRWLNVSAAEAWNTLSPTLEWIDATIVA